MVVQPQFPLGSVLFPSLLLPLHVFEPRYRQLMEELVEDGRPAEERTFGVVLIERGSEVGGGDVRTQVGTTARIVDARRFDDGRWAVMAAGVERFRIERWLPDDPYPLAETSPWPDTSPDADEASDIAARFGTVVGLFNRSRGLAGELGVDVGSNVPAFDDVGDDELPVATMQLAALSPLTTADKQALLAAPGPSERIDLLGQLLGDAIELLLARLGAN